MDSAVVFGSGNIGRGVLVPRLIAAGVRPVLVVRRRELLDRLRDDCGYWLHAVEEGIQPQRISGLDTVLAADDSAVAHALGKAGFVATAVGAASVPQVARMMAPALERRDVPLRVLICENMADPIGVFVEALRHDGVCPNLVQPVRVSVEPMAQPAGAGIDVRCEARLPVFVARSDWSGPQIRTPGLVFVDDIDAYYARKLLTNNAGHAWIAYRGAWLGHRALCDAAEDPAVLPGLLAMLEAASDALHFEYALDCSDLRAHIHDLVEVRYVNRSLGDTVARVARDPLRKLGPSERLVGLLRLLQKHGLPTSHVCTALATAIWYHLARGPEPQPGDPLRAATALLCDVSGIVPAEEAHGAILAEVAALMADRAEGGLL